MTDKPAPSRHSLPPLVWDLPLRFFHWSMVILVMIAALTGYIFEEWWLDVHVWAGYGLCCLLIFRVIWGFIGSSYSRFHTFPLTFGEVVTHLKSLLKGKSIAHAGHNPMGAWMIILLLSTMVLLVTSGLFVWGGQENKGPLAALVGYQMGEWSEDLHEMLAGLLLGAIALHILAVLIETLLFKHPLINAMISGRKDGIDLSEKTVSIWHSVTGFLLFIVICASFFYGIQATSPTPVSVSLNKTYQQECGDCHPAYHPSLRTKHDWQLILGNLSDHYGEDASLDDTSQQEIAKFLNSQNASSFESEVSHKIGRYDTQSQRITDTRYWQKKHDDLEPRDFSHPTIKSKVNCNGCHQDADSGRFDDDQIKLPKGIRS